MLRYLRSARTPAPSSLLSLWSRRSYRSRLAAAQAAAAAAGTVPPVVYHVKVNRARRLMRNAVIALGALYLTNSLVGSILRKLPVLDGTGADDEFMSSYRNVVGQPESKKEKSNTPKQDDRNGSAVGENGDEEFDEDDEDYIDPNALFIPLPWTFQIVESPPYKGTDPEWQTYIRVAKDRELLLKIRNEILEVVKALAVANPILVQRIGREVKVRKHWLDLDFPQRPPPIVVRNGLLLSPGSIEIVTSEVDPVLSIQIQRALVPTAFALPAYAFVKTLLYENFTGVARYFGWSSEPSFPTSPSSMTVRLPSLGGKMSESSSESSSKISEAINPNATQYDEFKKKIPSYELMRPGIQAAFAEFKKKWAETYQPIRGPPPRGSIGVSGLVELQSPVARIVLEVVAFWDPKTSKYDGQSMHVKLRSIRPLTRAPL
ncbi:hypothetical protein F503_07319 [Ophiostoma piceae UAMH 11346]|uniref:Uncharacterized protein n=1 Tax=Ophiostoma piceae (strain UAMH 11346) TaxID=1262450 RepID=S3CSB6_OPHP1|nr:hypothetical protein F503_07319 [Ophiostoma piceae UAMH 11346]